MNDLIAAYGDTITVTRFGAGSYVNGVYQPGTTTTLTMTAVVEPLSPTEMQLLPEGRQQKAAVRIYTDQPLMIGSQTPSQKPDRITWNGVTYEVAQSDARAQFSDLLHYKTVAYFLDDEG